MQYYNYTNQVQKYCVVKFILPWKWAYILLSYLFLIYLSISLYVIIQGYIVNTVQMTYYLNWLNDFILRVRLVPALSYWSMKPLPLSKLSGRGGWIGDSQGITYWLTTGSLSYLDKCLIETVVRSNLSTFDKLPPTLDPRRFCSALWTLIWTRRTWDHYALISKLVVVYIVSYIKYLYVLIWMLIPFAEA